MARKSRRFQIESKAAWTNSRTSSARSGMGWRGRLPLARHALRLGGVKVRCKGAVRALRREAPCGLRHVQAELNQHAGGVVGHVLVVDLVVSRHAVGDAEQPHRPAGGRTESAVAGVGAEDHGAVRSVEARILVAGPDHLVGDESNVRYRVVGVHGVGHDFLAAVLQAHVVPDAAVVAVGVVDVADVLLFPYPVGDADDVVDDVPVVGLEAAHRLRLDMLRIAVKETVGPAPAIRFERDPEVSRHVLVAQRIEPEMSPTALGRRVRCLRRPAIRRGFKWTVVGHGHGEISDRC